MVILAIIFWIGLFALSLDIRKGHKEIANALNRIADRLGESD